MSSTTHPAPPPHEGADGTTRRDFLTMLALASAAVGAAAAAWPFIDSMEPAADTLAAGEPI
jgi:ubiquinol-cytochrome c reductase iron-sulfur subunit